MKPKEQPEAFARLLDTIPKKRSRESGVFKPSPVEINTTPKKRGVIRRILSILLK